MKNAVVNGWRGEGKTVKEAKENAIRNSETAASGYYTPQSLTWKGVTVVVFREPLCWNYFLVGHQEEGKLVSHHGIQSEDYKDKSVVVRAAFRHLASITHEPGSEIVVPPFLDPQDKPEYIRSAQWQNAMYARKQQFPKESDEERRMAVALHIMTQN